MKLSENFGLKPSIVVWIFVLLSVLLFTSAIFEYRSRKSDIIKLLSYQASTLAETVNTSATHSILVLDSIEEEVSQRLFSILRFLDRQLTTGSTDYQLICKFAEQLELKALSLISENGKVLFTCTKGKIDPVSIPGLLSFIYQDTTRFMVRNLPDSGKSSPVAIGALRGNHGIILVGEMGENTLMDYRRMIGIGSLLNSIVADSAVAYIAIQDTLGIISASRDVDTLSSFAADKMLMKAYRLNGTLKRNYRFHKERIFEVALPFRVFNADYGMIRIGLDFSPFRNLQNTAVRQTVLRFVILLLLGSIVFLYSIAQQNVQYLRKERQRIEKEVMHLQEDLRRREKLSAMGHLAAGIAHEIRNPLNTISMAIQRLGKECTPAEDREKFRLLITNIRQEITRIGKIINQFLEFAKPASLVLKTTSVDNLLREVHSLYLTRAAEEHKTITLNIRKNLNWTIDPEKIKQVMMNLVDNALQATAANGTIIISGKIKDDNLILSVKDNGKGIPAEDLGKIFNLYFTTRPDGNGLGLAIVYQIVSEHDGHIDVKSRPGEGSEFIISIPVINKEKYE